MLLKQYLAKQGLALENDEVGMAAGDAAIADQQASAAALVDSHDEILADSEDLDAAETGEATLESIVEILSKGTGTYTSLESALINEKIANAFSHIGLSTGSLALESDSQIGMSMEGLGDTIEKIKEAVKNGYSALTGKIKDFLAAAGDHCARSVKLFTEFKSKLTEPNYKVSANAAKRWASFAAGLGDTPITKVFADIKKASKMVLVDYVSGIAAGIDKLEADYGTKAIIPGFLIKAEVYFNPNALGKKVNFGGLSLPKNPQVVFGGVNPFKGAIANQAYRLRLTPGQGAAVAPETISGSDIAACCDSLIESLKMASAYIRDWRSRDAQLTKMIEQVNANRAERPKESFLDGTAGGSERFIKWTMESLNERTTYVPREWIRYLASVEDVFISIIGTSKTVELALGK